MHFVNSNEENLKTQLLLSI